MASLTTLSSLFRSPTYNAHSSSSSSIKCNLPRNPLAVTGTIIRFQSPTRLRLRFNDKQCRNRSLVVRSTFDEVSVLDPPPPPPSGSGDAKSELIASLKLKLLGAVSGLNRGLAANTDDLQKADAAAKELEAVGGLVDLSVAAPITLGQVFQRIDVLSKDFDNIVELELGAPWPLPPVEVTATLAHKFELIGSAKIKIIFQKTTVKTTGNLSQLPPLELPQFPDALRPPSNTRSGSGEFEVTYLDADTRVTRGDRGELRVFVIS
ncbi:hypothetical protein LWI29_033063 [Acer saccharum]|uniref:Plastid lipid-associated protein/fibrillin conserved domain-containing protein n=1 Tax=Acer saccharum TaxID=4024 RepID=A0AA39TNZ0_ACESA|nr:hypothetical protein LWI29_033063 [Acer saccharum]